MQVMRNTSNGQIPRAISPHFFTDILAHVLKKLICPWKLLKAGILCNCYENPCCAFGHIIDFTLTFLWRVVHRAVHLVTCAIVQVADAAG